MELKHRNHNQIKGRIQVGVPVLLVGQAGSGKTTVVEKIAEELGQEFYCMSIGSQTSKSDLLGFIDANGVYRPSVVRQAFENGGILLMDEFDAGNPNTLTLLNAMVANGICSFPDGMIRKHEDFRIVASANTYGNGGDSRYNGRNVLDGATKDRFVVFNWELDETLERKFSKEDSWTFLVQGYRKAVEELGINIHISPRASIYGGELLRLEDETIESIENDCIFKGQLDSDTIEKLRHKVRDLRNRVIQEMATGTKTEIKVEVKKVEKKTVFKKPKTSRRKRNQSGYQISEEERQIRAERMRLMHLKKKGLL